MEIKYSNKKIILHYIKVFVVGIPIYILSFGKSDDVRLKNLNYVFAFISVVYIAFIIYFFSREWISYSRKTFIKDDKDSIIFKDNKIKKSEISGIKFFTSNEIKSYGSVFLAYPRIEVEKEHTLILFVNNSAIDIDLNDIYLEGNPQLNYTKIQESIFN